MDKIGDNKRKQINEIVSVVKLSSLLLTAVIFFQYYFKDRTINNNIWGSGYDVITIGTITSILLAIYFIWAFSNANKINEKYHKNIHFIENIIFIIIFYITIRISGGYESECKYIFLFIIITSTIQSGMKQGLIMACVSSMIILSMDLLGGARLGMTVNSYFENDLILAGIFILTAWPLGYYVKIEADHIEKLESLANRDGLTGVHNHRYFQEELKEKIIVSDRTLKPVSMIFIDIDYFKHYNDLYGHQEGDEVLRTIGSILRDNFRKDDIVARYGGEEFAIILPNTMEKEASLIADNVRKIIESTKFYGEENQPNGNLTVSMGISIYPDKAKNALELIKSADDALYRAKFFDKNRVETYTSILDELKKDIDEKDIDLVTSIKTLISVINTKDRYTYAHCERLVFYCRLLAEKLGLSEEDKNSLVYGAYMHDIGKINVPKEILIKKMPLTKDEWEILQKHPQDGIDIIAPVNSLDRIKPIILHHHEKYNGTGYPHKLKGEEIPYLARVLTIVDSFDAMTSNRPYNKRKTHNEAIKEIRSCSGTHFDEEIANVFIELIEENKEKLDSLN